MRAYIIICTWSLEGTDFNERTGTNGEKNIDWPRLLRRGVGVSMSFGPVEYRLLMKWPSVKQVDCYKNKNNNNPNN